MDLEHLAALTEHWLAHDEQESAFAQPLHDIVLLSSSKPTPLAATIYDPVACLILQGAKEVLLGSQCFTLGARDVLVVSHDVPVNSRITTARHGEPYLALIISLDVALMRGLDDEARRAAGGLQGNHADGGALVSHQATDELVDALARYLALARNDVDRQVLAAAVRREIHFRLLMSAGGGTLRRLLDHDSHESRVAQAISRIREGFRQTIVVPDLAREVGMSASSLHKHFRAITSTTPLQFQKDLRLLEARRLLLNGEHAVSDVAYEVGYESPNQFSREYSRKYGTPPSADLRSRAAAS